MDTNEPQVSRRIPLTGPSVRTSVAQTVLGKSEAAVAPEPVDEVEISSSELEKTTADESVCHTMRAVKRQFDQQEDAHEAKLCKKSGAKFSQRNIDYVNQHSQAVDQCLQIVNHHRQNVNMCPQNVNQSQQNVNLIPQNVNHRQLNVNLCPQNVNLNSDVIPCDDSKLTKMSAEANDVTKAVQGPVRSYTLPESYSPVVATMKGFCNRSEKSHLSSSSLPKRPPCNVTKTSASCRGVRQHGDAAAQTKVIR